MPETRLDRAEAMQAALRIWEAMTPSEKHAVRFGLFPHKQMTADDVKGIAPRLLSVALMEIAEKQGGMIA